MVPAFCPLSRDKELAVGVLQGGRRGRGSCGGEALERMHRAPHQQPAGEPGEAGDAAERSRHIECQPPHPSLCVIGDEELWKQLAQLPHFMGGNRDLSRGCPVF